MVSNALIAYGDLNDFADIVLILFGVAMPLMLYLYDPHPFGKGIGPIPQRVGFDPPGWAWVLLGILAIVLRFLRLESLAIWPLMDEGIYGCISLELSQGRSVGWFWGLNQMPLLFHWGMALLLKVFPPTLGLLWFYPAIFSILSVWLIARASLRLFPRSYAFLHTAFWATGFSVVYAGRFCVLYVALLTWGALTLYLGARWRDAQEGRPRILGALVWGAVVGVGFQIYYIWFVAAVVSVWFFLRLHRGSRHHRAYALAFGAPLVLFAFPILAHAIHGSFGYFSESLGGFDPWGRIRVVLSYVSGLLWGVQTPLFAYKPFWGGYLNPVSGSLFLLGAAVLFKERSKWRGPAVLAFLVLIGPGIVTNSLEFCRIFLVFFLLLAGAAYGLWVLWAAGGRKAGPWVIGLLLLSTALDAHHLFGRYGGFWQRSRDRWDANTRSTEREKAYRLLKAVAEREGPGYLFVDFVMNPIDRTLWYATQRFNVLDDPSLKGLSGRWVAILVDTDYRSILQARFPASRWTILRDDGGVGNASLSLGILRIEDEPRFPLAKWREAHRVYQELNRRVFHRKYEDREAGVEDLLREGRGAFEGDRFLESVYWERLFQHRALNRRFPEAADALHRAIRQGYPVSHLYNEWGVLLVSLNDREGARRAFKDAIDSPGDPTLARQNLELLK